MSDGRKKKGYSDVDSTSHGRVADPSVKTSFPSVSDFGKVGKAIGQISELSSRLSLLESKNGPFSDDLDFKKGNLSSLFDDEQKDDGISRVDLPASPAKGSDTLYPEDELSLDDLVGNTVKDSAPDDDDLTDLLKNDDLNDSKDDLDSLPVSSDLVSNDIASPLETDDDPLLDLLSSDEDHTSPEEDKSSDPVYDLSEDVPDIDDIFIEGPGDAEDSDASDDDFEDLDLDAILEDSDPNEKLTDFDDVFDQDEDPESLSDTSSYDFENIDLADFDQSPREDFISDFSGETDDLLMEHAEDEGRSSKREELDFLDVEYEDPIDSMLEQVSKMDADKASSPVKETQRVSPFAALFAPTLKDVDLLLPADIPSPMSDDKGDDRDSVSDELLDFTSEDLVDETKSFGSIPGYSSKDEETLDVFADWEMDMKKTEETSGQDSSSENDYDLPQLTMGGDQSFYAPGTSYVDDVDNDAKNDDDPLDFGIYDDEDAKNHIDSNDKSERVKEMSIDSPSHGKDGNEERTFDASDIEDMMDDTPKANSESDVVDSLFGQDETTDAAAKEEGRDADLPSDERNEGADDAEFIEDEAQPKKKSKLVLAVSVAALVVAGAVGGYLYLTPQSPAFETSAIPKMAPEMAPVDTAVPPAPVDLADVTGAPAMGAETSEPEMATSILPGAVETTSLDAPDLAATEVPTEEPVVAPAEGSTPEMDMASDMAPIDAVDLTDLVGEKISVEATEPAEEAVSAVSADPVMESAEMPADAAEEASADMTAEVSAEDPALPMDAAEEMPQDAAASLGELSLALESVGADEVAATEDAAEAPVTEGQMFVELERVQALEETIDVMDARMIDLIAQVSEMSDQMVAQAEMNSTMASRVESNERSLRGVSAILAEFVKVKEGLDQTQIVLLDLAARVGSLETANPAKKSDVDQSISEIQNEIKRLTANMAILARMTVNGVSALENEGSSSVEMGVETSGQSQDSTAVFADDSEGFEPADSIGADIPSDVKKGDFVEGYGYVLDIVPASGDQKLVVMENGSALIPN